MGIEKRYTLRIDNICMKFIPPLTISSACMMETGILPKAKNSVVTTIVITNYNIKKHLSVFIIAGGLEESLQIQMIL